MPRNSGGQTKGKPVPSIASNVLSSLVHVEVLDTDWNPIPFASGDYLTIEDAKAYIAREFKSLRSAARLFDLTTQFVMPVFLIDGEQYSPAEYTTMPIGGCWIATLVGGASCTFRIHGDGTREVLNRMPLPAGKHYPTTQALADALREVTA